MGANPWDKFFWNDWETDPALKLCSLAAQGLWMRILCFCAKADPKGYLVAAGRPLSPADLSSLVGKPETEVETLLRELASNGVYSTDRTGRIYSRRMVRAINKARTASENGKKGGNPTLSKQKTIPPSDNQSDKGQVKPHKPEARSHEPEPPKSPKGDDGFEAWYSVFPRHEGPGRARKAYQIALKKTSASALLQGAERYRAARAGQDQKYTMLPATWLNGENWLDETLPQLTIVPPFENTDERGWRDRLRVFRSKGSWSPKWGPRPFEPGCKCPPNIIDEDGKEAA